MRWIETERKLLVLGYVMQKQVRRTHLETSQLASSEITSTSAKVPAGREEKNGVVEGTLVAVSHDLGRQEYDTIVHEAECRPDDAGDCGPPSQLRFAPEVRHAPAPFVLGFLQRTHENTHSDRNTKKQGGHEVTVRVHGGRRIREALQ